MKPNIHAAEYTEATRNLMCVVSYNMSGVSVTGLMSDLNRLQLATILSHFEAMQASLAHTQDLATKAGSKDQLCSKLNRTDLLIEGVHALLALLSRLGPPQIHL